MLGARQRASCRRSRLRVSSGQTRGVRVAAAAVRRARALQARTGGALVIAQTARRLRQRLVLAGRPRCSGGVAAAPPPPPRAAEAEQQQPEQAGTPEQQAVAGVTDGTTRVTMLSQVAAVETVGAEMAARPRERHPHVPTNPLCKTLVVRRKRKARRQCHRRTQLPSAHAAAVAGSGSRLLGNTTCSRRRRRHRRRGARRRVRRLCFASWQFVMRAGREGDPLGLWCGLEGVT